MPLTAKENFRLGFLMRCAEEGCTMDEVRDRVKLAQVLRGLMSDEQFVKEAQTGLLGAVSGLGKAIAYAPLHAALLGIGGASILGAGAGYGAAKLQDQTVDPEEAKRQELIAAYRAQADRIGRKTRQTNYRRFQPKAPQLFDGDDHGI